MRPRPLRVLLVEHDPDRLRLLRDSLPGIRPPIEVEAVEQLATALERLSRGGFDAVLLDLDLPDSRGMVTFDRAAAFAPDVPIVVLGDEGDEDLALQTLQGGAQDHLFREEVTPRMVARSLRYAVERHRLLSALRRLSLIDDLTGLYNRRGFMELGERALNLAGRHGREVSLLHLDLDDFKTINDSLGHRVGDRALASVGDILRATFRGSDVKARIDGDGFLVLALEASGESGGALVARARAAIDGFNEHGREPYHLSASIALAHHEGVPSVRLEDLLAETGAALREQKERGPDRRSSGSA